MEDAERSGGPPRFSGRQWMRNTAERNLLALMFRSERWIEEAAKSLVPEDFEDAGHLEIYCVLMHTAERRDPEGRWLTEFPEDLAGVVESIRQEADALEPAGAAALFEENIDKLLHR